MEVQPFRAKSNCRVLGGRCFFIIGTPCRVSGGGMRVQASARAWLSTSTSTAFASTWRFNSHQGRALHVVINPLHPISSFRAKSFLKSGYKRLQRFLEGGGAGLGALLIDYLHLYGLRFNMEVQSVRAKSFLKSQCFRAKSFLKSGYKRLQRFRGSVPHLRNPAVRVQGSGHLRN